MSIHDETWDKCPKCKQTIKTWHGDYHNSGGCLGYVSFHDWYRERMEQSGDLLDVGIPNDLIGMLKSLEKVDPPKTKPVTSYFDKDFQPPNSDTINWKLMAERLWEILDDIDTSFDHYKPNMSDKFVNYVNKKCTQRQNYMVSLDGQTLTPLDIPIIEDLDPMTRWFSDAWKIEKDSKNEYK